MTTDAAPEPELDASPSKLDAETQAALEWPALLAAIGSLCTSASGKARALALHPAADIDAARARNQVVSEMLELDRLGIAPPARSFPDVSEPLERAARGGIASAAELWHVRELLELAAKLRVFARGQRESHPALSQTVDSPPELSGLEEDLAHSLEPDGNFHGYIITIATNLWRDRNRVAQRAGAAAEGSMASLDASTTSGGGETITLVDVIPDPRTLSIDDQILLEMDLDQGLDRLSPHLRDVLVSRFVTGESAAEIGQRYGRTEQTITGWIREAVREMKAYLTESHTLGTRAEN